MKTHSIPLHFKIRQLTFLLPAIGLMSCGGGNETKTTETETDSVAVMQTQPQTSPEPISYKTITIADQVWMTENLDVAVFRNGDSIPQAASAADWTEAGRNGTPAWCYYENEKKGSRLYNFFAVNDPRGLAPEGWEIPTRDDFETLIKNLGGAKAAAVKLKDTEGWDNDGNGNNESGFAARPEGMRNFVGAFTAQGAFGYWWSKTEHVKANAWQISLGVKNAVLRPIFSQQANGFSVRCIKK